MKKGFTLLELLLYVSIVGIVLFALTPLALNVIQMSVESSIQEEVYSSARYISERINYEIRNSTDVVVTATSITLTKTLAADNPTIITYSGSNVTIKRGAGTAGAINPTKSLVGNLVFTDYSGSGTKNVGYTMTIIRSFPLGARQEYDQSISLNSSAEVRGR